MADSKKKKIPKGKEGRRCENCGTTRGLIRKYGMMICRRCFREKAEKMGFSKF